MADDILHVDGRASVGSPDRGQDRLESVEDKLLLEGLRNGAEEAYETLIARFQQPVYNLVYRLLNEPGDASDVVQEVFLKVFRKVGAFRGESSLKTWIYRIAVNEAYNHQRWFARHRRQEVGLDGDEEGGCNLGQKIADRGRTPFDYAAEVEQHALIEGALGRLNPSFRTAIVLRDIEELSYEEIADVLQVALGTVKSRILRGREALRKELADRLEPEPALSWRAQPAQQGL